MSGDPPEGQHIRAAKNGQNRLGFDYSSRISRIAARINRYRSFPCTEKALRSLLGKHRYREIEEAYPDWRFRFIAAGELLQLSEREVFAELGELLQCQIAPGVIPTDLHSLPPGTSHQEMRRQGYITIVDRSGLYGVICANPARISPPLQSVPSLEFLLAPWEEISTALGKSVDRISYGIPL